MDEVRTLVCVSIRYFAKVAAKVEKTDHGSILVELGKKAGDLKAKRQKKDKHGGESTLRTK